MQNEKSKFMQGTVRETYSEETLAKARTKYSFKFTIDGVGCHAYYDPQNDKLCIAAPENGAELPDLVANVEAIVRASGLEPLDLRKFLYKHMQGMIKIERELRRAPPSERRFELVESEPIDTRAMSLEDQCLLEVLQEQSEKANQAADANGSPDDVQYQVTRDMVEAKMREKMQQPK